jgi:hypothetical protein
MLNKLYSLLYSIKAEPVLATTLVTSALVLLVQLGVPVSDGLGDALSGVLVAAAALFARSRVSPTE